MIVLVVDCPCPQGTTIIMAVVKQCLVVFTWRRVLISSIFRGGRRTDGVVGFVGMELSISACVAVSVAVKRSSICRMRLERNVKFKFKPVK